MLQESHIRPQSNDVRRSDSRGQAFAASALAPETVNSGEEDIAGAISVNGAAEEEGEGQEEKHAGNEAAEEDGKSSNGASLRGLCPRRSKTSRDKESPSGNDSSGMANTSPHALPVQPSMPMMCDWKNTGRSA